MGLVVPKTAVLRQIVVWSFLCGDNKKAQKQIYILCIRAFEIFSIGWSAYKQRASHRLP